MLGNRKLTLLSDRDPFTRQLDLALKKSPPSGQACHEGLNYAATSQH